ncbi:Sensor histidine kinase [hydrothermal vent metagenome]|uniref:histidine kinase n=1 Tax=hydrothermal vent metagenome TaxID=652676 RepID=A0A3B1D975_9ZZZZ
MGKNQGHTSSFQQLLRDAKLEAMAEFAAGAGHEINNPLATISGRVQLLLLNETDPQKRQSLKTIGGQVYRIRDMIGDAMLFGRPPQPVPEQLNMTDITADVQSRLQEQIEKSGCQIKLKCHPETPVWADPVQLSMVVSQLILNSLSASNQGGNILIECSPVIQQEQPFALFKVTDWGCGLTPEEAEHLFDPFYSGRQAGRGLGFGLSKCWQFVKLHGGEITFESKENQSTCFTVLLPAKEKCLLE